MSLIAFHKFLISTAIVFSLGFAFRQVSEFQVTGDGWTLIAALAFGAVAVAMVFYLKHLNDFLRIPSPRADLRPYIKTRPGGFSDRVFQSVDVHDEAEAADVIPVNSGNGHDKSKMPPIKENGPEG
jgi:hypothetical protein